MSSFGDDAAYAERSAVAAGLLALLREELPPGVRQMMGRGLVLSGGALAHLGTALDDDVDSPGSALARLRMQVALPSIGDEHELVERLEAANEFPWPQVLAAVRASRPRPEEARQAQYQTACEIEVGPGW